MKDGSWILGGWSAVPMILMLGATPVLTAFVMALPISWLVTKLFSTGLIRLIFGVDRFGYWHAVGLFTLWYAARFEIKLSGTIKVPEI